MESRDHKKPIKSNICLIALHLTQRPCKFKFPNKMNNQKYNQITWERQVWKSGSQKRQEGDILWTKEICLRNAEETPRDKVTNKNKGKSRIWMVRQGMLLVNRLQLVMSLPSLDPCLSFIAQPASFSTRLQQSQWQPGFFSPWHLHGQNKVLVWPKVC